MPRYPTSGISALSQLNIDADKVWATKGISNIKELALGMIQGDLLVHNGVRIIRFPASVANLVLTSMGVGMMPVWAPGGLYLNRYFPAQIDLADSEAKNTVRDHTPPSNLAPITSAFVGVTGNDVAHMVYMTNPDVALPHAAAKNTARTYNQPVPAAIISAFTTAVA